MQYLIINKIFIKNIKQALTIFMVCFVVHSNAQNKIPNSGFETYSSLPNSFGQIVRATGWTNPMGVMGGTVDYFNSFGSFNINDKILPKTGNGMAGGYIELRSSSINADDYKEYTTIQLNSPLVAGATYTLSFYTAHLYGNPPANFNQPTGISFHDLPDAEKGFLGAVFSTAAPNASNTVANTSPRWTSIKNDFGVGRVLIPASNTNVYGAASRETWIKVNLQYTAIGNETHMTLGQFRPGATALSNLQGVYYVYDDFSMIVPTVLSKSVSPSSISSGETATYTFTLNNTSTGNEALNNLSFTDNLPSGLRLADNPNVVVTGLSGGTITALAGGSSIAISGYNQTANSIATITVNVTNVTGQTNTSCGSNPAGFTNSATNISNISSNITNNVGNICLVVMPCTGSDSDGDGVADMCDLDWDNDGILNSDECAESNIIARGDFTNLPSSPGFMNAAQFSAATSNKWTFVSTGTGTSSQILWDNITSPIAFGNGIRFQRDGQTQSITQAISGLFHYKKPQIIFSKFLASNSSPGGNSSTIILSYAGVEYMRLVTSTGINATSTLTYSNGASGSITNIAVDTPYNNWIIELPVGMPSSGNLKIDYLAGPADSDDISFGDIIINACQDTDADGIPNYLDLDSDNDGCLDAIEGDENITISQLVNAANGLSVGSNSTASNQNLCSSGTCVDSQGVPTLVNSGSSSDIGNDKGQGIGNSENSTINDCDLICTENVNGNPFSQSLPNGNSQAGQILSSTFTQPGTNAGFVLDIYNLDNSFNLEINGQQISNQELQFQTDAAVPQITQNVRFLDGSQFGSSGSTAIWNIDGTPTNNPAVKIIISASGQVSMLARKSNNNQTLYPLQLINGAAFNTVTWNSSTANNIKVTQVIRQSTQIVGTGYGKNVIPCSSSACYKPGINNIGNALETKTGITTLNRAGSDTTDNWPMTRKGGWLAIESRTKGFVINRVAFSDADSNPSTLDVPVGIPPANFVEGMMVYDTTNKCLKIYTSINNGTSFEWRCFSTQTCPD